MKKQIQLYYDPEDETYRTLISAKNKTYLLDVCYKFSVEFYKCQMKEENPDCEEVICYLIAMMYLLRQGGSLPGIAARGTGSTGELLQERMPEGQSPRFWERDGNRASGLEQAGYSPTDMHRSADMRHPTDTHHLTGTYPSAGAGQPMGMQQSAGTGQPMDMRKPAGTHQPTGMYQSADMQSSDMKQPTDTHAAYRYQAEDGNKSDSQNWLADGNPALASVMADVEIK